MCVLTVQGPHGLVDALARLQQQQHLVDGRVRPLHQAQLLPHPLYLPLVGRPRRGPDPQSLQAPSTAANPLEAEQVLGQALRGAVQAVQDHQGVVQELLQGPEHTAEHGPLHGQVWGAGGDMGVVFIKSLQRYKDVASEETSLLLKKYIKNLVFKRVAQCSMLYKCANT